MKSLWRVARKSMLLWFGAAFLTGGLVCLLMGIEGVVEERRFRSQSRFVAGVVLGKSIQPASRQGNSSTKYEITYRFTTENGMNIEGTDAVSVEKWESLDAGSRLEISYLPGNPQSSRAASSGSMESPIVAIALGSLFAIVGGFFFLRSAIGVWRQWSILRAGDATQGTVIAIEPSSAEINNVRLWEVRYRYRDHFGSVHEGTSVDVMPSEAYAVAIGDNVKVRFDRDHPEQSVWDRPEISAKEHDLASSRQSEPRQSFWQQLKGFLTMLALVFVVIILGEIVLPITGLDRLIAQYEAALTAATIGTMALGFALFMGGVLYRIFSGGGTPMSHTDVEDLSRSMMDSQRLPNFARASKYRFKGKSAGSSFHDQFSIREAKEAWKQRAWRDSLRWRGNFVIMGGAFLFALGLFSIFIVIGPNGIRLLCGATILYAVVRTFVAFARA